MKALAAALVEFQKNAPTIHKDARNPHFGNKYASLDAIMDAVRAPLAACGLAISQHPTFVWPSIDIEQDLVPSPALKTILFHESGEVLESSMMLAVEKAGPQAQGSALTYARRYAVLAVLGLVADEDDDGEAATRGKDGSTQVAAAGVSGSSAASEEDLTSKILAAADKLGAKAATEEAVAKSKETRTPAEHVAWLKRNLKTAEANVKTLEETTEAAGV